MRSCQASAYGQWLQVKTTTAGPSSECSSPAVSGSVKSGAGSPMPRLTAALLLIASRRSSGSGSGEMRPSRVR